MENISIAMILDGIVLLALAVTIFFSLRLSRQFSVLKQDQENLDKLIKSLDVATDKAEQAVQNMKSVAIDTGEGLQSKINVARSLFDELEIMIQAGDNLAERLSQAAESSRKKMTAEPKAKTTKKAAPKATKTENPEEKGMSRAEKELLAAVKSKKSS